MLEASLLFDNFNMNLLAYLLPSATIISMGTMLLFITFKRSWTPDSNAGLLSCENKDLLNESEQLQNALEDIESGKRTAKIITLDEMLLYLEENGNSSELCPELPSSNNTIPA